MTEPPVATNLTQDPSSSGLGSENNTSESASVKMIVTALTGLVFVLVAIIVYALPARGGSAGPSPLATLNAFLNSCATLCLLVGFFGVKTRRMVLHRRAMLSAFGISCMFLLTYLLHHAQVGTVPFQGKGVIRSIYFAILVPHILLSAVVVPLALLTIYRGWTNRIQLHRKVAKIALPLWLFVSVSGVVVYYMLYHMAV